MNHGIASVHRNQDFVSLNADADFRFEQEYTIVEARLAQQEPIITVIRRQPTAPWCSSDDGLAFCVNDLRTGRRSFRINHGHRGSGINRTSINRASINHLRVLSNR